MNILFLKFDNILKTAIITINNILKRHQITFSLETQFSHFNSVSI